MADVQSDCDRMSILSGISGTGGIDREDRYSGTEGVVSQPHWMWIAAGSCRIDPLQPPASWFVTPEAVSSQLSLAGEPWRVNILQVRVDGSYLTGVDQVISSAKQLCLEHNSTKHSSRDRLRRSNNLLRLFRHFYSLFGEIIVFYY